MHKDDEVAPDELSAANIEQDPSTVFADQAYLTYCVPAETDIKLETALRNIEDGKASIESIPQRDFLFFDETVDVLLILKSPWLEDHILRSHLSRLVISLEAQIVNSSPNDRNNSSFSDTIFAGNVKDVGDPLIIVDEQGSESGDETAHHIYAVWKVPVSLSRPRVRLLNPSIVFSAFAGLKPEVTAELNARGSGYLQSGLPAGLNLLESFSNDPGLHGVKPRLSALRVSRVAPVTQQQDMVRHLRARQQLQLTIFAVVHTRIRFSRPNTTPPSSSIVALLEVDFTPHVDCEVLLDKIELAVPDCVIFNLNDGAAMRLPLSCVSHDHVTFLYHIKPHELDVTPKNPTRELDISISASVQVTPGVCTPRLNMSWITTLDFTTPVNPGFGPTAGSGIQRSHRPSQLSISGPQAVTPLKSPSVTRPDALPALEAATSSIEAKIPDLGITMSFNGPDQPIRVGEVFSWTVYVVNRSADSNTRTPRKLALVAIPKRRRNEVRPMRPPSTASRRRGEPEIADAFVDENVLHAMQRGSLADSPDVVCLSADTRVGPLAAGACHVVELQFVALQEGLVGIEAIRVVDLTSQEHVDIRELPTVMVQTAAT